MNGLTEDESKWQAMWKRNEFFFVPVIAALVLMIVPACLTNALVLLHERFSYKVKYDECMAQHQPTTPDQQ